MEKYEKLYKEALERAREFVCKDNVEVAEYIFPELKESEDEKIRKAIYNCVEWFGFDSCFFKDVSQEECLAWLEKQGEQKSYASETMNEKGDFDNGFTRMMEKEQNPVWSEEDEKVLHAIRNALNYEKPRNYLKSRDFEFTDILDWLKSLKDRMQTKPKQEWSEEDRDYYDAIIAKLEVTQDDALLTDNQMEFLKSLKERYTWRPSDEQIKALEHFVRSVGESGYASPYDNNTKLLYLLLSDLKKLKG